MYRQLHPILVYPKKGKKKWSGWRESNPRDQLGRLGLYHWATPANKKWSEQQDSNLRPPGPKPGALPNCAMPRHLLLCYYSKPGSWCQPLLLLSSYSLEYRSATKIIISLIETSDKYFFTTSLIFYWYINTFFNIYLSLLLLSYTPTPLYHFNL